MRTLARALYRVAATLGFILILITVTPVLRWWTAALSSPWGPDSGDTLVILGGEMYAPDTLGITSYWRSFYGALVWRKGHFKRVIVTGHETAPLMADFLVGHGVPREAITVENDSATTRENAINTGRLLGPNPGSVILLTSDYHSARALWIFRKVGIKATALPFPDALKRINLIRERWTVFVFLVVETAKTAGYHILYR